VPIKPQRVYEEMNQVFGRDTRYVTAIGLSQIAGGQFLQVFKPRNWINCGQAGPLGWTVPAALGVVAADPTATVVGLSGDYDFQFLIEELAVGAQFNLSVCPRRGEQLLSRADPLGAAQLRHELSRLTGLRQHQLARSRPQRHSEGLRRRSLTSG
jgi:thiamine pyrophosphate-dependent enzyme